MIEQQQPDGTWVPMDQLPTEDLLDMATDPDGDRISEHLAIAFLLDRVGVQPITTPEEHQKALARLDALMDAEAGTPEANELQALGYVIAAYEKGKMVLGM